MKKNVVLILLILPIFLLITISFAGRIFATYNYIYVERVAFVDNLENELDKNTIITINKEQKKILKIKVYPELATNKDVVYLSQDSNICAVDDNGEITGIDYGTTTVIVKSIDGNKTASLLINVSDSDVSGITLTATQLNLAVGEIQTLYAVITPMTAVNKNVVWTSSNRTIVDVDANGRLNALSSGTATITATTVDGGYTATCIVNVSAEQKPPIEFTLKPEGDSEICFVNTKTINLRLIISCDSEVVNIDLVKFMIKSGKNNASITGDLLTINNSNKIISIVAYVGDSNRPTHQAELNIVLQN